MKTSINREYTTLAQAEKVKNDLKELKAMYTEGDLLRAFLDTLDTDEHRESMKDHAKACVITNYDEIVCCNVEGFPAGTFFIDESGEEPTHFSVTIKMIGLIHAYSIHFYTDLSLNIRLWAVSFGTEQKMYSFDRYTLDK